jgi:transposase-like protein
MAGTREAPHRNFDAIVTADEGKYPEAAKCLQKNHDALLAFHDFPAPRWQRIRMTNPIESTFAAVRLKTAKAKDCVLRQSLLSLGYRRGLSAEKRWRRFHGFTHFTDVVDGVAFIDGVRTK